MENITETINNFEEPKKIKKRRFKIENIHPYTVILSLVLICLILAWILPAGEFVREAAENGDMVVVPGSYHSVEKDIPSLFDAIVNVQLGFIDTAQITFFIIFAYAFVYMLTANGTMSTALGGISRKLGQKVFLFIPVSVLMFGLLGSTAGLYEEVYGLIPVFIGAAIALGYDAVVGGAIVFVGVATGFAAAITNPFTIGIAQSVAKVPLYSGMGFRIVVFVIFEIVVMSYIMYYAKKVKKDPTRSVLYGIEHGTNKKFEISEEKMTLTHKLSLVVLLVVFGMTLFTTLKWGWYIDELAGLFLSGFFIVGFISRYSLGKIMDTFIDSCKDVMFGVMTIGFIRAAIITLENAQVMDTITYYLSYFLVGGSKMLTGFGMLLTQNLINLFIPGGPAQAMATMPIMSPICDLAGIDRQIAIVAFQFGDGFSNMFWPTGVAIECGLMGIPISKWYKFMAPLAVIMIVLQVILMFAAIMFVG